MSHSWRPGAEPDVKVTVSIGVAASDQGLASADALLDAADQAA
jgi:PleD family two-component response regulator